MSKTEQLISKLTELETRLKRIELKLESQESGTRERFPRVMDDEMVDDLAFELRRHNLSDL